MFRKQDMSGIATIHYPLRHVEASPREIGATIHIDHTADRTAVYSHAKFQVWVLFERAADFDRALRRRFWTGVKDQRHSIPSWNLNQASSGFSLLKLLGTSNHFI